MAIRAAMFDFGGVLSTGPFEAFARYEREQGLPVGFLRRVNTTDPETNAWARLERGELDFEGFCRAYEREAEVAGGRVDGAAVLRCTMGNLRPEMIEAVRRCRERLATALLTNNWVQAVETPGVDHVLGHFDVVLESSRLGIRKPDPRFYERALAELGVAPEEAVFLDDLGPNLKPARAMGIHTIKVTDPEAALRELEAVVGFPVRG